MANENKRKYTKKSSYWKERFGNEIQEDSAQSQVEHKTLAEYSAQYTTPDFFSGEPYYSQDDSASCSGRSSDNSSTSSRSNSIHKKGKSNRYKNIENGILPYDSDSQGYNVRDTIELCQKAYANVSVVRNTIDIMAELANSQLYLEGGNAQSRKFIAAWLKKIKIFKLKDQYFREYYRSGNVFLYKIEGRFDQEDFKKMVQTYGAVRNKIPLRYIVLNPYDITQTSASSFVNGDFKKVLSDYEIARLRTPITLEDKEIFNALPPDVKKMIKVGGWNKDGINFKLEPSKLLTSFYKKQDYEPFAIPFIYPVLDDINWKLELKKIDAAISRTVENVILLVKMGAEPSKGGINQNNLAAMQKLLRNESVGRYLVADWTTEAEFIIPDLKKVLGPEKYEVVDRDIREGLLNILIGSQGGEKFSNQEIKTKIFLERLNEARENFLNDVLQSEIKLVCETMGFKSYPIAKFAELSLKDEVQLQRVAVRLIELGVLHPEDGIEYIKTGILPEKADMKLRQTELLEERKGGFYNPLLGGVPLIEGVENKTPTSNNTNAPTANGGNPGGSNDSARYAFEDLKSIAKEISDFTAKSEKIFKETLAVKKFNKDQRNLFNSLIETIILGREKKNWDETLDSCVKDFSNIAKITPLPQIVELADEHKEELYNAALLYHSQKI